MRELVVTIARLDDDGRGVGEASGLELHVSGALPGETVRAEVEHESPHVARAWAKLVVIESRPADERVEPACPAHPRCGGCVWQHYAYPAQLTEKRRAVERALGPSFAGRVDDVVASPHEIRYRNKAKYAIAARPGGLRLGSYAPASHDVLDMAGCRVPELPIDEVARAALALVEREGITAYDDSTRAGELRHLVVRANHDGEVLCVWVARTDGVRAALTRAARALRAAKPQVAGVVLHVNARPGGAIFAGHDLLLDGVDRLTDKVGEVLLELSARAFFQVNRAQAARIYLEVARLAGARAGVRVVDLYTGVGGIALTLAARGARVEGVEVSADAIDDARRSASSARLGALARFRAADAAVGLPAAARDLGGVDVLVVNPPRKGLSAEARAAILALAPPRIIYVSCSPQSLAADLAALGEAGGYTVAVVRPYDLMPGTPHVETVVALDAPLKRSPSGSAPPGSAGGPAPRRSPPPSSRRRG